MSAGVLSSRFDLPFYLRLPSKVFFTWDPEATVAAVLPRQRLGEVSFSRATTLVKDEELLDSPSPPPYMPPGHDVVMKCVVPSIGREISTLSIDTTHTGGFTELRPYTEITMFVVLPDLPVGAALVEHRARVVTVLNHFLTVYRLLTQDPWVVPINDQLDLYLVDDAVAVVPEGRRNDPPEGILSSLGSLAFAAEVGKGRQYKYRLNTLEDLFPGPVLEREFLERLATVAPKQYDLPIHYDLVLQAQTQLKRRNYHVAVLEAETAFEVYVADLLVRVKMAIGEEPERVMRDMEDPHGLGHLMRRITALDQAASQHAKSQGLPEWRSFKGMAEYREWKEFLYDLRNRIAHGGYRQIEFDQAKRGILAAKRAISFLELKLPAFANPVQIYPGVDHLVNTAGRLSL